MSLWSGRISRPPVNARIRVLTEAAAITRMGDSCWSQERTVSLVYLRVEMNSSPMTLFGFDDRHVAVERAHSTVEREVLIMVRRLTDHDEAATSGLVAKVNAAPELASILITAAEVRYLGGSMPVTCVAVNAGLGAAVGHLANVAATVGVGIL